MKKLSFVSLMLSSVIIEINDKAQESRYVLSGSEKKADDLFETQILFDLVQLSKMLRLLVLHILLQSINNSVSDILM